MGETNWIKSQCVQSFGMITLRIHGLSDNFEDLKVQITIGLELELREFMYQAYL